MVKKSCIGQAAKSLQNLDKETVFTSSAGTGKLKFSFVFSRFQTRAAYAVKESVKE